MQEDLTENQNDQNNKITVTWHGYCREGMLVTEQNDINT